MLAATPPQKPSLRLDVRSEKQAVLLIEDPALAAVEQEATYHITIDGYVFTLNWRGDNPQPESRSGGGLLY